MHPGNKMASGFRTERAIQNDDYRPTPTAYRSAHRLGLPTLASALGNQRSRAARMSSCMRPLE